MLLLFDSVSQLWQAISLHHPSFIKCHAADSFTQILLRMFLILSLCLNMYYHLFPSRQATRCVMCARCGRPMIFTPAGSAHGCSTTVAWGSWATSELKPCKRCATQPKPARAGAATTVWVNTNTRGPFQKESLQNSSLNLNVGLPKSATSNSGFSVSQLVLRAGLMNSITGRSNSI